MVIYFITGNKNKFNEFKKILPEIEQLEIDLPEIQENNAREIIKAKLLEGLKYKESELIVEDTSLYFDCLNGLPGPLIKWFMKKLGNKGLFEITKKFDNYKAEAKTIIGYAKNKNEIYYFEGSIKGKIVPPRGKFGFGWDSIFIPEGYLKSFAELTNEEKNKISMRKIALIKLKEFLLKEN
jgi:non-canonical purine NTP pyrophosphatase (RdgB/HAM1 family)